MGNNVKEGIPFATALGLVAVELAAAGFTGPVDFLDEEKRYDRGDPLRRPRRPLADRDRLLQALWLLPLGACRDRRAARLMREERLAADEIQAVHVETFTQALSLNNDLAPPTLEAAQYSVPFCLAAAAIHGGEALLPLEAPVLCDRRSSPSRRASLFPSRRISIRCFRAACRRASRSTTARGVLDRTVLAPRGEPVNPLNDSDLLPSSPPSRAGRWRRQPRPFCSKALRRLRSGRYRAPS